MNVLRVGVIGLGQRLAHVLRAMDDVGWPVDVIGYVDPAPVGLPILESRGIGAGHAFKDVGALLAAGPFDLLLIGSPNHLHLEHLKAAMAAGAPIFVEKPIVRTESESLALARHLSANPVPPIYVGLVLRSMPIVRELIARIDGGQIGRVVSIDATEHLHPEHGGYLARNWRRKKAWGGSFLLDKVCHDFDIFGRLANARAARVASFGGRNIFHAARADKLNAYSDGAAAYTQIDPGWAGAENAFRSDMDVADHQVALVEYANDVRLSFHSNSHVALQERRWYIAGEDGTMIADLVRNRLIARSAMDRGKPERIDFHVRTADLHNGADQAMAEDLRATLERRKEYPVTVHDSLEAGLTVMAIDRAMDEKAVIDCAQMWSAFDEASRHVR
jgi:predicted dehydrogenase